MLDPELLLIRQRYVASLLPVRGADRRQVAEAAAAYVPGQRPDGTWADIPYNGKTWAQWGPAEHMRRVNLLARAFALGREARKGCDAAARRGLDWWLAHDPQCPNWWWNQIGVPEYMGETLLFLESEIAPEQTAQAARVIMTRAKPQGGTGANLVWLAECQIVRGLLTSDASLVADAYRRIYDEIRIAAPGREGIQADNSFHQHGAQFYSDGYGFFFGNDCARFTAFAWGTRYQIPADRMEVLASYLLDGQQWMIRGEMFDYSASGRTITRKGKTAAPPSWDIGPISPPGAAYGLPQALRLLNNVPGGNLPRRIEFAAFADRLEQGDTPRPRGEVTGNRHYYCSDYMAHRRDTFFASVRMYSSRLLNTENTLGEGKVLHHIADGATFLYRRGDEYFDIFPFWDWRKIPGTTAEQDDPPLSHAGAIGRRGRTDFVGGVSDGTYGVAVMDFARDTLTARKSYFAFDEEIVCLGAGIGCDSAWPVATAVNQCRALGRMERGKEPNGIEWVLHDGVGYVFPPGGSTLQAVVERRTGRWSDIGEGDRDPSMGRVFSLWLDHGVRPRDAHYAYLILPTGITADALRARAATAPDPARVIANMPTLQVVQHARSGVLLAAFYEPGVVRGAEWKLAVDQPCAVCVREMPGGVVRVAVSNPRNKPLRVALTLDRTLSGDDATTLPDNRTRVVFELPDGPTAGSSVVRELRGSGMRL